MGFEVNYSSMSQLLWAEDGDGPALALKLNASPDMGRSLPDIERLFEIPLLFLCRKRWIHPESPRGILGVSFAHT